MGFIFAVDFNTRDMNDKILALLVSSNGQYNLPKDLLEKIAGTAPVGITDDEIPAWVEGIKPQMALMQSFADSRVSEALKKASVQQQQPVPQSNQVSDLDGILGSRLEEIVSKTLNDKLAGYKALEDKYAELLTKQSQVDEANKANEFKNKLKSVANSIGLDDELLNLVSGKITPDMDDASITNVLADCKKTFINRGLLEVEGDLAGDEAQARKRAEDWVNKQIERNNQV